MPSAAATLFRETEILYRALSSPLGLVLRTSNFALAQARLYKARRDLADPALARLQLRRSPINPEGEIWIVKAGEVLVPKEPSAE